MAKVTLIDKKDGQGGVFSPQEVSAQQALPTVQAVPVVAWDHRNGQYGILNQGFLAEICVLAERSSVIGRVAEVATAIFLVTAVVGDENAAVITVPADELWFINQIVVTATAVGAGERSFNIEVDLGGGVVWDYFPVNQAHAVLDTIDVVDLDQLGTPLKLPGGSKVTLRLRVTVNHTVGTETSTITLFGSIGRRIV